MQMAVIKYNVRVKCLNCGIHTDMDIEKGVLVSSMNCKECGCKTLELDNEVPMLPRQLYIPYNPYDPPYPTRPNEPWYVYRIWCDTR